MRTYDGYRGTQFVALSAAGDHSRLIAVARVRGDERRLVPRADVGPSQVSERTGGLRPRAASRERLFPGLCPMECQGVSAAELDLGPGRASRRCRLILMCGAPPATLRAGPLQSTHSNCATRSRPKPAADGPAAAQRGRLATMRRITLPDDSLVTSSSSSTSRPASALSTSSASNAA